MDKILFVVNPIAGGGKAKNLIPLIKEEMDKHKKTYDIVVTKERREAIEIVKNQSKNYEVVVAVGGDGTVNEVAIGLIQGECSVLGIIPGGTGNDMARSLNIPMEPTEAIETLCKGYKKYMDIGLANKFNFLNIASVGFDAEVVRNNIKIKKKIKSGFSYAISVVYTLISFKKKKAEIEIDGKTINEDIYLLAVGNGKYYGGGLKIMPEAVVDDGYLHVCIISNISKAKILFLLPTLFKGTHIKHKKHVKTYKAKEIKLKSEEPLVFNVDGEILPNVKEIEFGLEDKKIKVICEES